jgi:hypothetical protein
MDNREAKFILSAYRPDGQDVSDPRFAEALEQTRHDPILRRWFEESVAFDAVMMEKLRAVTEPSDLRESILAGAKIGRGQRWTNRVRKWAIAAAVILTVLVGISIWQITRPTHLTGWQNQALGVISSLVRQESRFDAQSRNAGDLLNWLRANHAPAAQKLPSTLEKLESLGCKKFSWNGTPVSVICFTRPDGGLIHLIATNATFATGRGVRSVPSFAQRGDWATATWREGDKIYMLTLEGSPDQLRAYVL